MKRSSERSNYGSTWLVVIAVACSLSGVFAQELAAQGLVGYYSFDAGDATDDSGNMNDGAVGANVTFGGIFPTQLGSGQSAAFTGAGGGTTGIINVPNSASLQSISNTLSVGFWIKADHTANANWVRVIRKASEGNPSNGWIVNRNNNTSDLLMRTDTQGPGGAFNQNRGQGVGVGMLDDTWHYYTHVRDNGTWIEYVDGVPTGTGGYPHGNGFSNTEPLQIGGRSGGPMNGRLDDVAVFTRRLDPTEITALADGDIAPSGLVSNIEVVNTFGDVNVTQQQFIPIDHLSQPTLSFAESATGLGPSDVEIKVSGMAPGGSAMISLDKDIVNNSSIDWLALIQMTLGTGLGDEFVEAENNGLFFMDEQNFPAFGPLEKTGAFPSIVFEEGIEPERLTASGFLALGDQANFWMGIVVPDDIDGIIDGMATFTLRQQVLPLPEPGTLIMAALGLLGMGYAARRRRQRA